MKRKIIGLIIGLLIFIMGLCWCLSVILTGSTNIGINPSEEIRFIKTHYSFTIINPDNYSNYLNPWGAWMMEEFRSRLTISIALGFIWIIAVYVLTKNKKYNGEAPGDGFKTPQS